MIAIVEHKNGDRRSVRDDIAMEYIACVPCKGRGERTVCIGSMGNLAYYGWQMAAFQGRCCGHCDGAGIMRIPALVGHARVPGAVSQPAEPSNE